METQNVIVKRTYFDNYTTGEMFYSDKLVAKTLELPWKNNQRGVSCIPEGEYLVTKEPPIPINDPSGKKERKYWHFRLHNVPNRSGILIHRITYVKDLRGCIGVGSRFVDLNADKIPDVVESSMTLQYLVDTLPDRFKLKIISP